MPPSFIRTASQDSNTPWLGELQKCYRAYITTSTPGLSSNSHTGVCKALEAVVHLEPMAGELLWAQLSEALLRNGEDGRTRAMLQVCEP